MGKLKTKSILSCAVLVAMISGVQSSYAMPSGLTTSDAISTRDGNTMKIEGKGINNVLNWKTFDISPLETVMFDGGLETKNYLNLIHDNKASEILGTLTGGKNVYLINPNGFIFGEGCSVNVGNLYVSTRPLDQVAVNAFETSGADPLANSATKALGDIVNLGATQATKVYFEGNNVTLTSESVKGVAGAVVRAQKDINVGFADGQEAGNVNETQFKNNPDATTVRNIKWQDLAGYERNDVTSYWQIRNVYELQNMKNNLSANYALVRDIDIILNGVEVIGLERVLKVFQAAKDYQRLNRDTILLQPGLNINLAGQVIAGNTLPLVQFEKDEE